MSSDYVPQWILVNTLTAVGIVVLWYLGLLQDMLRPDRTKVSLVIFAIFVVTALNCLYHTVVVSRELVAARKVRAAIAASGGPSRTVVHDRIGMSSGMAIALNVTVAGVAVALILKFEYYLLDEAIADLFRSATELNEVYVVPALEPAVADVPRG